ncbi:MAG: shikimate dehydrogenase [Planctomycetota bacterium]
MTRIVVPVSGRTLEDIDRKVHHARAEHADLVELRLDMCARAGAPIHDVIAAISEWPLPVIATNRHASEQGQWEGSEEDRLALLLEADRRGAAYIDVELARLGALRERPGTARLILSHHDFDGLGSDLADIVEAMYAAGAAVAKVAVTLADAAQLDVLAELCANYGRFGSKHQRHRELVALGMGEIGLPTRLLAGAWGCGMTFARLSIDPTGSAPGQPTTRELTRRYRLQMQGADTCIFGVIGDPVAHSLSPAMHNAAFAGHGVDAVYVPFLVHDAAAFWQACHSWIDGLSITIPHKAALIGTMDTVEDPVQRIGAMNTVYRDDTGRAIGANTDAPAAIACLEEAGGSVQGKRALVLGAGGVSHALAYALVTAGAEVVIANRTESRAEALADRLGCTASSLETAHDLPYDILLNGTSVGMNDTDSSPWPADRHREDSVVFDTVYTPLQTRLLRDAADQGATTVCGLNMLEHQAVAQYCYWTGLQPPLGIMHRAALESLGTHWTDQIRMERM